MGRKKAIVSRQDRAAQKALEATPPAARGSRGITKAQAVREALAQGKESPGDIVEFLRDKYGLEMTKQVASSYKVLEKKREAKRGGRRPGRQPKAAVEGYLAPPKIVPTGEGDLIDAMEQMKPLIAQHGAETIKRMVDLLG